MAKERFQNGKTEVNTRQMVLDCGFPAEPGESRKAMLQRAAKNAGFSYARVVAFFYGKGNPPDEAKEKLAKEAARIKRAWMDLHMDQRLAELAGEREKLAAKREEIDRQIAAADRALAYGRRQTDR